MLEAVVGGLLGGLGDVTTPALHLIGILLVVIILGAGALSEIRAILRPQERRLKEQVSRLRKRLRESGLDDDPDVFDVPVPPKSIPSPLHVVSGLQRITDLVGLIFPKEVRNHSWSPSMHDCLREYLEYRQKYRARRDRLWELRALTAVFWWRFFLTFALTVRVLMNYIIGVLVPWIGKRSRIDPREDARGEAPGGDEDLRP